MQKERPQSKWKKSKISESEANEILQILDQKQKNFEAISLKNVLFTLKDLLQKKFLLNIYIRI